MFDEKETPSALRNLVNEIYQVLIQLSESEKGLELIEIDIETMRSNMMNAILQDKNLYNDKPKYTNEEQRKVALKLQEDLSETFKITRADKMNAIELQKTLKALIEVKRKNFRVMELEFLFAIANPVLLK